MRFTWSERKRVINLKDHGLDFVDALRNEIHIISFRKATGREARRFFDEVQD